MAIAANLGDAYTQHSYLHLHRVQHMQVRILTTYSYSNTLTIGVNSAALGFSVND